MRSGRGPGGSRRWIIARLAAVAALATVSLVGVPGTASASGTVTPLLDCVIANSNGTYSAVLGYSNTTGRTQAFPYGTNNVISPSKYDRAQPTSYYNGTYHGVFKVTMTVTDVYYADPYWRLNGITIDYADVTSNSCPPATQMPAEGNGTGTAAGLLAAGVIGAVLVRRYVRRAGKVATGA
jgi:hypothetical protein